MKKTSSQKKALLRVILTFGHIVLSYVVYVLHLWRAIRTTLSSIFNVKSSLIRTFLNRTFLNRTFLNRTFLIGTFLNRTFLMGTFLIRTNIIETYLEAP